MTNIKAHNLPFLETIKRSFVYSIYNFSLFLKVSSVALFLVVIEAFNDFPILCTLGEGECSQDTINTLTSLFMMFLSIGVIVNYCRSIILKSDIDFYSWSFIRRSLWYLLASVAFGLFVFLPFMLFAGVYGYILQLFGWGEIDAVYMLLVLPLIAWIIYLSPLFMIFVAITVDDKSMTIKEAFKITKGNSNKIFWGQIIMMLPCTIAIYALGTLYQITGADTYIVKFVYMFILLALSFLDSCFKASFFAHIYQYFTFYQKKKMKL